MKTNKIKVIVLYALCTGLTITSSHSIQCKLIETKQNNSINQLDEHVVHEVSTIMKNGEKLFSKAQDYVNKLLWGKYKKDHLKFSDFIQQYKGVCTSIKHELINKIEALKNNVSHDPRLTRALTIVHTTANKIYTMLNTLCTKLSPYEKTKNQKDVAKIIKILSDTKESFVTEKNVTTFKKDLRELKEILSTRSTYQNLTILLQNLQNTLDSINIIELLDEESLSPAQKKKILNQKMTIVNNISKRIAKN